MQSTSVSSPGPASPADRLRGRLMAQSLGRVLDQAPGSRDVLPHLAALERSLLDKGCGVIDNVPAHHLAKIGSQLSSLPLPGEDAALQDLLSRLVAAVKGQGEEWSPNTDFDPERTIVIREISHSEFAAVANEQATTLQLDLN